MRHSKPGVRPSYFAEPMPRSSAASRSAPQQDPSCEGPLETIKKLSDAWIRKDRRGMSRQLAADIIELGPAFPKALVGKHSFFEKYRTYFSSSLRIERYRILSPSVIHLTPQLVLVHFRYRMKTGNRDSIEKSSGQESMLLELKRGRWLVKFIHWHRT
jgi:hypothetical protein